MLVRLRTTSPLRRPGNPWRVGDVITVLAPVRRGSAFVRELVATPALVVALYEITIGPDRSDAIAELGGHDLTCWCPLDTPCHADVLLSLANPPEIGVVQLCG